MRRPLKFLIWSIVVFTLSCMLMKLMYVIDPSDSGMWTSLVIIFVNAPMWVISIRMFCYSMSLLGDGDGDGDKEDVRKYNNLEQKSE